MAVSSSEEFEEAALVDNIASMLALSEPCDLYGKKTWKIREFSQINRRELRSTVFEVGGHKWHLLLYPKGYDESNEHLSLFLCVADHDNLLPDWSHFAQFTLAIVNNDPIRSKCYDTMHCFWEEEHDWGWKKFIKSENLSNGFLDNDTLTIKVQVQVIRERDDRPFRCLELGYKREVMRVYMSKVDEKFRRFVEEKTGRFKELIEEKDRMSSFYSFWVNIDADSRREMLRMEADLILRDVVNHFFIEKEVASTLMMESLYSGLRALEENGNLVGMENGTFILLTDDVLVFLERAALELESLSMMKDHIQGSVELDERYLIELGRITMEIFVLYHIFG